MDADRVLTIAAGREARALEGMMPGTLAMTLALARFGGFHGGGRSDGFGWLLLGLAAVGVTAWIAARSGRGHSAED